MRVAWVEIERRALQANLDWLRQRLAVRVMAVLKANAYGHGMAQVATSLNAADAFAVARLEEALQLRACGITRPIVLLEGVFSASELPLVASSQLQLVVHHQDQLNALLATPLPRPIKVWLKVDTGMNRLGLQPDQLTGVRQQLGQCKWVSPDVGLMSHLACADQPGHPANGFQRQCFAQLAADWDGECSLSNSAAVFHENVVHYDWVRPGLLLYGVTPVEGRGQSLRPAMTLKSSLIAVRSVKKGDYVGYGWRWQMPRDSYLGVVAIGYGDGYPRQVKDGTPVWIGGHYYPLVGAVSMDMITVDLGPFPKVRAGDEVELWGRHVAVSQVARAAGTIPYELLCNITRRVKYRYL